MRLSRCFALALALALVAVLAGCGSDGGGTVGTTPTAVAPDATTPPPDATQPGTTAVTPPPAATAPGAGEGEDAGGAAPPDEAGEQSVRVPASFAVVSGGRLDPPEITVPPFLAVEVSVRADDGRSHRVQLRTPQPQAFDVPAGQRAAVRVAGLRAGRYEVLLDGRAAGAIVAGGEVGP